MNDQQERATTPIVWVLGAGASRGLGGPLLSEMFTVESWHSVLAAYPDQKIILESARGVVQAYAKGVWGIQQSPFAEAQAGKHRRHVWEHAEEFLERLDRAVQQPRSSLFRQMVQHMELQPGSEGTLAVLRDNAVRLMAAECSHFLRDADLTSERWRPYVDWSKRLTRHDTVITFNYDTVTDLLAESQRRLAVYVPGGNNSQSDISDDNRALVLKLHGSVDWLRDGNKIVRRPGDVPATLTCKPEEFAIAVPGTSKLAFVSDKTGALPALWRIAQDALTKAKAVLFVGYRFPPTDSWSRRQLLRAIAENKHGVVLHTVLGDDVQHPHSRRLKALLHTTGHHDIRRRAMFAEDFFGTINPADLCKARPDPRDIAEGLDEPVDG